MGLEVVVADMVIFTLTPACPSWRKMMSRKRAMEAMMKPAMEALYADSASPILPTSLKIEALQGTQNVIRLCKGTNTLLGRVPTLVQGQNAGSGLGM